MAPNFHPKFKRPTLPSSELIEMHTPDLYYSVQQAFQNEGVLLVDLDTGEVIEGQVNVSDIGLTDTHQPLKVKRRLGFIPVNPLDAPEYEKGDINAILVLDETSQQQGGAFYLIVQVIEDKDLDAWIKIVLKVARHFVTRTGNRLQPEVIFGLTSLSRGNGVNSSARKTALRKIRRFEAESADMVSGLDIPLVQPFEDDDDWDEEENEV